MENTTNRRDCDKCETGIIYTDKNGVEKCSNLDCISNKNGYLDVNSNLYLKHEKI